jgi:2-keto-4-pentenoate hydratase
MRQVWDDPRVREGMRQQLAMRRALLDSGATPLGWKVGFGAPAAMQKLGITGPLIGFMTARSVVASGATASFSGWSKPIAEPEIAVHIGRDVAGGGDRASAAAAVAALGPAVELVDLETPPEDPQAILAGNIYHRHVVLGPKDSSRAGAGLEGLSGHVFRNGIKLAEVADLEANTGKLIDIVRHVADMLAAFGERLRAGEVIICGSVVPPIALDRQDRGVAFRLEPGGEAAVAFTWS